MFINSSFTIDANNLYRVLFGEKWRDNLFLQSCRFIGNKDFHISRAVSALVSALIEDSNISSAFTFTLSLTIPFTASEIQLVDKSFFSPLHCCWERLRHGIGEQSYRSTVDSPSNWMFHLKSNNNIIFVCPTDDHRSDLCSLK